MADRVNNQRCAFQGVGTEEGRGAFDGEDDQGRRLNTFHSDMDYPNVVLHHTPIGKF